MVPSDLLCSSISPIRENFLKKKEIMTKNGRPKTRQWIRQNKDIKKNEVPPKEPKNETKKRVDELQLTSQPILVDPQTFKQQETPLNLTVATLNRHGFAEPNVQPIDLRVKETKERSLDWNTATPPHGQPELTNNPTPSTITTTVHHQNPIRLPHSFPKIPQQKQYINLVKPLPYARNPLRTTTTMNMRLRANFFHPIPRPAHTSTPSRFQEDFDPQTFLDVHQVALPTASNNNFVIMSSTSVRGEDVTGHTNEVASMRPFPISLPQQQLMFQHFNQQQIYPPILSFAANNPISFGPYNMPNILHVIHPPTVNHDAILQNTTTKPGSEDTTLEESNDTPLVNAAKIISLPNGSTFFAHPHYGVHKLPQSITTVDKIPLSLYSDNIVQADYFHPILLKLFAEKQVIQSVESSETTTTAKRSVLKPLLPSSKEYKSCVQHLKQLENDEKIPLPVCGCEAEQETAPSYANLGAAPSLEAIRELMERRTGLCDDAIRIKKIVYTNVEACTPEGCPLAKHVLRRTGHHERYLILVRHRELHKCATAWIIVAIVAWDGVHPAMADRFYSSLSDKLGKFGMPCRRKCEQNEKRSCSCQGTDQETRGVSLSFSCSYSTYHNGCKYTRSANVRKCKLSQMSEEQQVEELLQSLATKLAHVFQQLAPYAYANQVVFEESGLECRLGRKCGRPWSGVTTCLDFCAHAHRDRSDMYNGSTVVITLTKHRGLERAEDEQLHILPMYTMDTSKGLDSGVEMNAAETVVFPKHAVRKRKEYSVLQSYGGVALSLTHGSLLFECARHELHATTALKSPNRFNPTRLSLVYYQHKNLNARHHGFLAYQERKSQQKQDESSPAVVKDESSKKRGRPPKRPRKERS